MAKIIAVCISEKRGTQKTNVKKAMLLQGFGIENDAHAGDWHRQVSLLSYDKILDFKKRGAEVNDGAFGENLVVQGIDFSALPIGTVLGCGAVRLEVTQIGKECHKHCQIYDKMGECIMPTQGIFARVLCGGEICEGDEMRILPKPAPYRVAVITASDKGFAGLREDKSEGVVRDISEKNGYEVVSYTLLPDDKELISAELRRICDNDIADLILTTGGTGFSVRDITPEATLEVAERMANGIAEAMRSYSMGITPRAMLSRGVAVLRKRALIINLPGSPKAVEESLMYIMPTLRHGIEVLKGDATECAEQVEVVL